MKLSSLQIDMADYDDNDNYQYRNHFLTIDLHHD